ncbi:hypothetical protein N7520_009565 [Penicillium odoratum]|uniref:uncharacterized protein n=1 Tax=Penicillium odoratum TaxID=1167516 RepID=UPI002548AE9A|nr:uncharacterized protein N7520_009565 [Penicillium odoratum]KAJ5752648.1 hypothetical protein N7520_009565 [Penicillium odoratum]
MPPLPNPPFVFPAQGPDNSVSSEPQRLTPPALPAFSFNPGSEPSLPPVHAPTRPNGHRRRPSEFVGDNQLVTPGDDKREEPSTPTQPSAPAHGPPRGPGRRNHAHRRSQAVSGVDLMAIQKALATPAGSAPNTPGDLLNKSHEDISRPLSYSAGSLGRPTPPASPHFPPSDIPPVPPIPTTMRSESAPCHDADDGRPVSAVFHETLESPATIKHTSPEIPTPPSEKAPTPNRKLKPRPKTADASLVLDFMQTQNVPGAPSVKRSKSTGHRKSKSRSANLNVILANQASDDAHSTDASRPSYSDDGSDTSSDNEHDDDSSPKKSKSKKKQKKVRSWAGAILGKGKRHAKHETELEPSEKEKAKGKQKRPSPLTPPTLTRTNSEAGSVLEVDFDNDDVLVIRTPTNPEGPVPQAERSPDECPVPSTLETSWKPRSFYEQTSQDEILSSPIIDLDAALGPFNTPEMGPTRGNLSQFSLATQRMYSGGRRGEFVGPEMRYHRRTESAPVMQPFDRSALGPIRLGGKGAETPDVFYEEEEDAFLAENQSPRNGRDRSAWAPLTASESSKDKKPAESVKSDSSAGTLTRAPVSSPQPEPQPEGLGIQSTDGAISPEALPIQQDAPESLQDAGNSFTGQAKNSVEIIKSEETAAKEPPPPSPDVSPGFLAVDKRPSTSPNHLPLNIPPFSLSAGVSPSESYFPSPDALRFPDRNFSSHSYHHLPSDYPYPYGSVEDVPSLTSSASTTTNTRSRFSATFFPRARLSTDRAASFSAAVHRRSSQANSVKRSSMASLSKLVGGPHSERSKLYHQEKPPGDAADKARKKNHRITRLMHFWKVKDKEKSAPEPSIPERPV